MVTTNFGPEIEMLLFLLLFLPMHTEKWPKRSKWPPIAEISLLLEIGVAVFNGGDALSAAVLLSSVRTIAAYYIASLA